MAEGLEKRSLDQLEEEITCAVCHELYAEPKILPCLHYYCKECILKLASRDGSNQPFPCPECREKTTIPDEGIDSLKTAFFVNRFKSNFSVLQRVHGVVEVPCEGCSDSVDKAEAFCRQCAVFICKECVKQHKRMKAFTSHEVVSLEDLKLGRAREIATKEPQATKKCEVHEEPVIIFCSDCNILICHLCTVKAHKSHEFDFCKVVAPDKRKSLLETLVPLKNFINNATRAVNIIQEIKQEVEVQGKSVADAIHSSFAQLQLILQQHKQQLLHEADSRVQEKIGNLSAQEKNLTLANAQVQSVIGYTERFVDQCSANEIMNMQNDIKRRIEHEIEEYSKSENSLELVEEADMGVEVCCAEDLENLCQVKAMITRLWDPVKCIVSGKGKETAVVDKTAEFTLSTNLPYKTKRSINIASELKPLYDGSDIKCTIDQIEHGHYHIQYTPTDSGSYELTVSVNGQQVAGSPFSVFVSCCPTELDEPFMVWNGISLPTGIAVNSENEVIACNYRGDIVKLIEDDDSVKTTSVQHFANSGLSDLALDKEDNIYSTDWNTNIVGLCDKNGGNVRWFEVTQWDGPGYNGITVVGDEVMLCERNNGGAIMIYSRELEFVRCIVHEHAGEFVQASADVHCNLYVTDCTKSKIHVFSNDGVVLRSFGFDSELDNQLSYFYGVCVSGQYVYVTDKFAYNVTVFTTEGDYVATIGQRGHEEGEFRHPSGICADENDSIFVCDAFNDRIQCF